MGVQRANVTDDVDFKGLIGYLKRVEVELVALRQQAAIDRDEWRELLLRQHGFTTLQARIALAMYRRSGRLMTHDLYDLINGAESDTCIQSFRRIIVRIRKVLGPDTLINVRGEGYLLSAEGRRVMASWMGDYQ